METTRDGIRDVELFQSRKGYRFSVDSLLLEDFISLKDRSRVVELGAGSGIISILLAKRLKNTNIVAVELQRSLAGYAEENVRLNLLDDRVEIVRDDIRNLRKIFPAHTFDCVLSNPPFRKIKSGRLNIDSERAVARHEVKISLIDIVRTASYMLKDRGKFYLIYHPFRMIELTGLLHKTRLEPKRVKFVHPRKGEEAKMVLIEAVKGSGSWLTVEHPFYIHNEAGTYSIEMKRILGK
jgi:tRNA1Val (adenine37-N6)-methyltransferase